MPELNCSITVVRINIICWAKCELITAKQRLGRTIASFIFQYICLKGGMVSMRLVSLKIFGHRNVFLYLQWVCWTHMNFKETKHLSIPRTLSLLKSLGGYPTLGPWKELRWADSWSKDILYDVPLASHREAKSYDFLSSLTQNLLNYTPISHGLILSLLTDYGAGGRGEGGSRGGHNVAFLVCLPSKGSQIKQ